MSRPIQVTEGHLCAGFEQPLTCVGDNGGPLMQKREGTDKWMVIGIATEGSSMCFVQEYPTIYTRVDQFLDWIERNTA